MPTYPPDPGRLDRTLPRLRAIARDSGAQVVLTASEWVTLTDPAGVTYCLTGRTPATTSG